MIKDLINVFKKTYEEYNKDKIAAKNCVKNLGKLLDGQVALCKSFYRIEKLLDLVYIYCPEHERKTLIQPLLDFLKYRYREVEPGPENSESYTEYGYIKKIEQLARYLEYDLKEAKELYDKHQYKECVEYAEKSVKYIRSEYEAVKAKFIEPKD